VPVVVKVVGVCALMAIAAQIRVPVPGTPVPMTLQSFAMVLAGLTLSPAAAASAMLLYVGLGAAGLPVFAPGSLGVLGPTGGYLFGFIFAAALIGVFRGRSVTFPRLIVSGATGLWVLFLLGVSWLAVYTGGNVVAALAAGLLPFALKGVTEVVLAVLIVKKLGHRSHSAF
jgi:biotin transport system substrate-specific component